MPVTYPAPPHIHRLQRSPFIDISAYTKGSFTASANYNHPQLGTLVNLLDSFSQRIEHITINRIQFLRTVQLNLSDMTLNSKTDFAQNTCYPVLNSSCIGSGANSLASISRRLGLT